MKKEEIVSCTGIFLVERDKICLAIKKKGICAGSLMPYGGHIKEGESLEECACRELLEEARAKTWPQDLKKVAVLRCHNHHFAETPGKFICIVHFFVTTFWLSEPKETEKMGPPEWFRLNHLPYLRLPPDDKDWMREWLPDLAKGEKKIVVTIWRGPDQGSLEKPTEVREVENLPDE